jgi:hypothetical protein
LRYKSAKWESKAPRVAGGGTREGEEKQKLPGHGRGPERLSHDSCVYKSFYLVFLEHFWERPSKSLDTAF